MAAGVFRSFWNFFRFRFDFLIFGAAEVQDWAKQSEKEIAALDPQQDGSVALVTSSPQRDLKLNPEPGLKSSPQRDLKSEVESPT